MLPASMRRFLLGLAVLAILVARFVFPARVQLDWPTVTLVAIFLLIVYAREFSRVLPLVKRLKIGEAEIEMRESVERLHKEVENAEETDGSHIPALAVGSEDNILELASRDKESAIVRLAIEIEKELATQFEKKGLTTERPRTIRTMVENLASMKILSPATAAAIVEFRNVRNQIIHPTQGGAVPESVLASAIDSGIRILRILQAQSSGAR